MSIWEQLYRNSIPLIFRLSKSFFLNLRDPNSILEGWAIVDNTTDEDWNHVKLSVVSGRPISFISLLDTPRYGRREIAELPEDRAAGPVVYAGGVDTPGTVIQNEAGSGIIGGAIGAPHNRLQRSDGTHLGAGNEPLPEAPGAGLPLQEQIAKATTGSAWFSSVEGASGTTLGELFEYSFASPVTIKKNQSAMLPFLQDKVTARKLLIYTERDGEHPVNAAEMTNDTGKTLDEGPITVYDCGAYAGEALFETLKPGDRRLIGYAVDYGTRITSAFDTREQTVREVHARNGFIEVHSAQRQTRTYTIRNVDAKPKIVVIQQEGVSQYAVLSPKPVERTTTAYRFEVQAAQRSR